MIYYLDCEFDGYRGPLISLALVREDGESRCWVLQKTAEDPWVVANVLPILWRHVAMSGEATGMRTCKAARVAAEIADFLDGDPAPCIVADWPADIRYFCDLIEFPGGEMAPIPGLTFEMVRVDAYPTELEGAVQHNAWWDAMALRLKVHGS